MPGFASSALRLLRRILGSPSRDGAPYSGRPTPLDGNSAIAITEAGISEGAGLGAGYPADTADLAWRMEQHRITRSPGTDPLWSHGGEGPRGALATAIGLSLSGVRATTFLSSADLASAQDLLASAAGRHLPLVVHLANRALAGHATAMGSGHEVCHAIADSGCFMLFAANVQEAVDFTLVARRVAENTLVPGVVITDGEQTALAIQDVRLPGRELVTRYLGDPDDRIDSPTTAQQLVFGDQRRRLPRWHDSDRPVLLGGLQSTTSWGLGKTADLVFDQGRLALELELAFKDFHDLTGRSHHAFSSHRLDDAHLVLVVQGAAIETAMAVADHLRSDHRLKAGVLGLRALRPLPADRLIEALGQADRLFVLERTDSPAADAPPLSRELQALFSRTSSGSSLPLFRSVIYGLGGLPLRGADLIELCIGSARDDRDKVYLGVDFAHTESDYPKRQVILDRLRREYPETAGKGLVSPSATPDLRPPGALTLAIHRISGKADAGLATEAAGLLQMVMEGQLRSRPDLCPEPWGRHCVDRFTCAPANLHDPGDQMPIDLLVLLAEARPYRTAAFADLQEDGLLLLEDAGPGSYLPRELATGLRRSHHKLYRIAAHESPPGVIEAARHAHTDYLLGAVFGALLDANLLDIKPRRLPGLHEQLLMQLPEIERSVRMDQFARGLERVHRLDRSSLRSDPAEIPAAEEEAPLVVRRLRSERDSYDSLPRFWDQVGVLYHSGESNQLSPDPYLASGAMPPLSSAFRDLGPMRQALPSLDPALCDGCGHCWSRCPDGAIGAIAQTPAGILDTVIGLVGADAMRPVASKLAGRIASQSGSGESSSLGELLDGAADWLQEKVSLPAARAEGLRAAVAKVKQAVGELPVVATEPYLSAGDDDAGELLFLAINPDTCKGCGICVSACGPGALTAAPQPGKALNSARGVQRAWERLPDTPAHVRERIGADPRIGRLAACLLSRDHTASLTGGDSAEPGSGERLALRLVMSLVESRQQPAVEAFVDDIRTTADQISQLIRETLTGALPADDLDALSRGLDRVESQQAELSDLVVNAESGLDSGIDARRLRRLVHLAKGLRDLAQRLSVGSAGLARARLGMVLSAGNVSHWAAAFPNNPFAAPVVVDLTRDSTQLAIGLLEGQLRQSTEGLQLMRRARRELEHPDEAARAARPSRHLGWRELTAGERAVCPPLLVVCGDELLRGGGLSQIDNLLGSGLPLKLLVLTELDLGLATRAGLDSPPDASTDPGLDLALLALARRKACIAQSSIAHPAHLERCLETALATPGPALLHLHAPSPSRHGFGTDDTLTRARLAVESRLFPLFLFDPQAEGVFGSRLSLEGNPQVLAPWSKDDAGDDPTPASWALGEQRFSHLFTPTGEDEPEPTPVGEYLSLDDGEQAKRTPVVRGDGNMAGASRYSVAPELIRVCNERRQAWRMLQEIAGLVTPFTAQVEQVARDRVAAEHAAELAALRDEFEARITALQSDMLAQTRETMRQRMMQLAGYGTSGTSDQGDSSA